MANEIENEEQTPKRKRRRGAKARLQAELKVFTDKHASKWVSKPPTSGTQSFLDTVHAEKKQNTQSVSQTNPLVSTTKSKKKKRKGREQIPKPGEEGYMTPTQLRNARKRRAKQSINLIVEASVDEGNNSSTVDNPNHTRFNHLSNTKRQKVGNSNSSVTGIAKGKEGKIMFSKADPSMRYIKNPRKAPLVKSATRFFQGHPIFQKKKMNFKVVLGPLVGWRTVSKLAVRKSPGNKIIIGLFTPKSHSILSIPNCPAHHPSINYATNALQLACESCGVCPYDEHTGKGNLRYVCINVERSTGKTQITLVWNREKKNDLTTQDGDDKLDKLLEKIIAMGSGQTEKDKGQNLFSLHSLWVHRNTAWKHSNAIFDITAPMSDGENASWKLVFGPEKIDECILPASKKNSLKRPPYTVNLQFPPNVFRQANIDAFAKIVERIRQRVLEYNKHFASSNKDEKDGNVVKEVCLPSILELYGGVGTIGLHLADLTSSLICSDENIHNPKCFENALSECISSDIAKNCKYIRKNAAEMVTYNSGAYVERANVIIVDPPRKGLDETVIKTLIEKKGPRPKLLIYVSCGFDAFQKNCKTLEVGGWELEYAEGHILFPGSDAIETLAFFVS